MSEDKTPVILNTDHRVRVHIGDLTVNLSDAQYKNDMLCAELDKANAEIKRLKDKYEPDQDKEKPRDPKTPGDAKEPPIDKANLKKVV